jgi:molybdopterin/thiamine biosynthesis adenylyltransferase
MRDAFHHEALYRGQAALDRLSALKLTVCGAGAVGSNLVDTLVRQGVRRVTIIDFDRVEAHNIGTQAYAQSDVGAFKVEILQAEMFRIANVEIEAVRKKLAASNVAQLLAGADLVVDGFDNHEARALVTAHCQKQGLPCLHVGLGQGYAEIRWNEGYRVPSDVVEEGADVCDYPMARNLVQFAVALASEAIVRFALQGARQSYSFTLQDLQIHRDG